MQNADDMFRFLRVFARPSQRAIWTIVYKLRARFQVYRAALDARGAERGPAQVPVQVGVADVESEGPSRAAGGGLADRLPVRGAFVAFLCVCTSVPALSWGQYRRSLRVQDLDPVLVKAG